MSDGHFERLNENNISYWFACISISPRAHTVEYYIGSSFIKNQTQKADGPWKTTRTAGKFHVKSFQ